jgi:hypothetical protein
MINVDIEQMFVEIFKRDAMCSIVKRLQKYVNRKELVAIQRTVVNIFKYSLKFATRVVGHKIYFRFYVSSAF